MQEIHPAEIAHLLETRPAPTPKDVWGLVPSALEKEIIPRLHDEASNGILGLASLFLL